MKKSAMVGLVCLLTLTLMSVASVSAAEKSDADLKPASPAKNAEQWAVFEASFTSTRKYDNPFLDVNVDVLFRSGDQQWLVPAFWAGGDTGQISVNFVRKTSFQSLILFPMSC